LSTFSVKSRMQFSGRIGFFKLPFKVTRRRRGVARSTVGCLGPGMG
jgi:hypothetical protein